jgi:MFS transporter, MHS family, proline/betaine transporter
VIHRMASQIPVDRPTDVASGINPHLITAGIVGNVLEWYDFAVYGYFAPIIGKQFFPSDDPTTSVIAAFGVFAAGFLMRPFGSIVFGHIGDKVGRRQALILSVVLMAIPTFAIGLLPGYATLGVTASVLLVILRMLQGLSAGGEYTTSIVFLVEHSPADRRAFVGCWSVWGAVAGILGGSAVGALIANVLSGDQLAAWGWRLPFLLGIAIGTTGFYLRDANLEHGPIPAAAERPGSPVVEAFRTEWRAILKIAGFNIVNATGFYLCFVYVTTWLSATAHVSTARALDINSLNMALLLVLVPLSALVSDRIGRKPLLMAGMLGILLLAHPLFSLMHHERDAFVFLGQLGFVVLVSLIFGTYPVAMVEMVTQRVRVSALSIGYNLSISLFGGTTPIVAAYLIARTRDDLSPAYYLMATAVVSIGVLLTMPETAGRDIHALPSQGEG